MYSTVNFKTKKALRLAVESGARITVYQPGPFANSANTREGTVFLEGPHYPAPHKWYAQCELKDGIIISVK